MACKLAYLGASDCSPYCVLVAALLLLGCATTGHKEAEAKAGATSSVQVSQSKSELIEDLKLRRSVLPSHGTFASVANSVVEASSGAAAAEVRMARLKADARSKNWLPTLGPTVGLSSLTAVAAQIVLEQAILDNGRRKAERDLSLADVEVAAVRLAQEMNDRVYDGLQAYLNAQRARAQAQVAERAVQQLTEFERIVQVRVVGGLSDRSEEQIVQQKLSEMQATLAADRQASAQAFDYLRTLTGQDFSETWGIDILPPDPGAPETLATLLSQAEGNRTLAEARIARSGMLPEIRGRIGLDSTGDVTSGVALGGAQFGIGSLAAAKANDAVPDVVARRIQQAREDGRLVLASLNADLSGLRLAEARGRELLRQTHANLELFEEQYSLGTIGVVELVAHLELATRLERENVAVSYDVALTAVKIARERGLLVDGTQL